MPFPSMNPHPQRQAPPCTVAVVTVPFREMSEQKTGRYHERLVRDAIVNAIGTVFSILTGLFFLIIVWLFGPETRGEYFLVTSIIGILS